MLGPQSPGALKPRTNAKPVWPSEGGKVFDSGSRLPLLEAVPPSQASVPSGLTILNPGGAAEVADEYHAAVAVNTQPSTVAVAVLVSVAKVALPLASLVALPEIEHVALLTDTLAPGDGTCGVPCS